MRRIRLTHWAVWASVTVLVVVLTGFLIERSITTAAFDRLEAAEAAQDAGRLRVALDAETRLLAQYGATNSIWDESAASVRDADRQRFLAFKQGQEISDGGRARSGR